MGLKQGIGKRPSPRTRTPRQGVAILWPWFRVAERSGPIKRVAAVLLLKQNRGGENLLLSQSSIGFFFPRGTNSGPSFARIGGQRWVEKALGGFFLHRFGCEAGTEIAHFRSIKCENEMGWSWLEKMKFEGSLLWRNMEGKWRMKKKKSGGEATEKGKNEWRSWIYRMLKFEVCGTFGLRPWREIYTFFSNNEAFKASYRPTRHDWDFFLLFFNF